MAEKLWGRELDWWKTVLSLLQLIVVSVGIALFNFFLSWHDKRQSENAHLAESQNQLTDEAPEKYKAGLQSLLLRGDAGLNSVTQYVVNNENSCLAWPKAHFIVTSLGAKNIYSRETIGILLKSWACHPQALGRDAELLRVLQDADTRAGCNPCQLLASWTIKQMPLFQEAALLSIVDLACSKQAPTLFADIRKDFKTRVPGSSSNTVIIFSSFTDFPSSDSFGADSQSLRSMAQAIGATFSNEPKGRDALWQQLRFQSLQERIIFGRFVLQTQIEELRSQGSPAPNRSTAQQLKMRKEVMQRWLEEGLKSDDRTVRYAAVAGLASFKWNGYFALLRKIASGDPDPYIRQMATLAMQPEQNTFAIN